MELLDSSKIDKQNTIYTVALEPGFAVDVKVNSETGLVYVMQNEDGTTVYDQVFSENTFPDYEYDEEAVVRFVKENCICADKEKVKPGLNEIMARASSRLHHQAQQAMSELDKQISFRN